ncbi:MAG: glycosyltransferase family 4 protein [Planctomycetaceae bacterium]
MHIAMITAGGAGMFCGSCMHDNTWARALTAAGAEVTLLPTYTPIRVDEEDRSASQVFLGGINVYMDWRSGLWRRLPRWLVRWLDRPWIINLATRFGVSNDASGLGPLTLAMLAGDIGPQRREVDELVTFLTQNLKPDVICFSNALLSGVVRPLRARFDGNLFCVLQGDDVFLAGLPEPYRSQAIEMISARAEAFDGFLVHSRYYRDFMAEYLRLPSEKFHLVPLGIDLNGHDGLPRRTAHETFTVGYFARVCPEKGLHQLLDAFRRLHAKHPNTRLVAGGYLGKRDEPYFRTLVRDHADLGEAFRYVGSPATHAEKVTIIKSFDVLSIPTVYHDPKGLPVLEALANGVPVVQPRHGAFPELVEATGGGILVEPGDPQELADALEQLMHDDALRYELAVIGHGNVHQRFDPITMARATLEVFASPAEVENAECGMQNAE